MTLPFSQPALFAGILVGGLGVALLLQLRQRRPPRICAFGPVTAAERTASRVLWARPDGMDNKKRDEYWRKQLNETQFQVMRRGGTDPRGIGRALGGWDDHWADGSYACAGCQSLLYDSRHKVREQDSDPRGATTPSRSLSTHHPHGSSSHCFD